MTARPHRGQRKHRVTNGDDPPTIPMPIEDAEENGNGTVSVETGHGKRGKIKVIYNGKLNSIMERAFLDWLRSRYETGKPFPSLEEAFGAGVVEGIAAERRARG